jgi:ATP-binding cassette subfamily F protein uup
VPTEIIELDRGQLYRYKGNYAYFLEKKEAREEMLKVEVSKARQLLKKELEWMRKQPRARGTKAKYRIDAYYELEKKASIDLKREKLELDVKESRQGGKILEVHHISKKYGALPIVNDFSYVFKKSDRIGVVGKNGIGKSTFLDMLTGKLKSDTGEILPGVTTKYGYFTQEAITLNPNHRVIEEVKEIAEYITMGDGSQLSASKFLETFLFSPEKQYNFIDKLSGGEKKRLQLMKLLITSPNFLILDEPTNDFDIDTLNVLEDFLLNFKGCLLLVSHDRYFMDHLVDQLFVFEGDGKIRLFNGNYSDYRSWADGQEQDDEPEPEAKEVKPVTQSSSEKRKPSNKEKMEFNQLQSEIEKLEKQKAEINALLNGGSSDHTQLTAWGVQLEQTVAQLDQKTERWLELSVLME